MKKTKLANGKTSTILAFFPLAFSPDLLATLSLKGLAPGFEEEFILVCDRFNPGQRKPALVPT
jgi:hypothetical protein